MSANHRLALLVGMLIQVLNVMGGYFALIYFSPTIFAAVGGRSENGAIKATVFLGLFDLCATVFYAFFADSCGRRIFLLIGVSGLIAMNLAIAISATYSPIILPLFACVFVLFQSSSVGPTA